MKNLKALILILIVSFFTISCFEDSDDNGINTAEINDFVWRGMNAFYLYKQDIPNLANDRFSPNETFSDYLNSFSKPEDLFESLIYERQTVDRFSWIVDDYIALEQLFSGVTTSNGMEFRRFKFSSTDTNIYGIVTHVLPNTSAASQGVKRGDIFYAINDTQLTDNNRFQLLNQNNYTINLGTYNDNSTPETSDDFVTPSTTSISLTKSQYTENPILVNNILTVESTKIAYLMYNGFTGTDQFNAELNNVFGTFKSANATELVLDLRYNPGGSVNTAILLSSMITGQFTGDVFSTEEWNTELQEAFQNQNPESLINRFVDNNNGTALNTLNLSRVYVLTTSGSASASELVINSLSPYINVVQIGTSTAGKYQASTTLYDSPNFRRSGADPRHAYAMQPLIFKSLNVDGFTDYFDGLPPDILLGEQLNNLGVLGDVNEPLLAAAIANITGTTRFISQKTGYIPTSKDYTPYEQGMYIEKDLPTELIKSILLE